MQSAEITIKIIRTDNGNIRINFSDGGSYLVKDEPCNFGLLAAFDVEIDYQNKKLKDFEK